MKFKVGINTAIEAVDANLKTHVVELRETTEVWAQKLKNAFVAVASALDREGVKAKTEELLVLLQRRPVDCRAQYSKYLGALKMSKEVGADTVEMNEDDYDAVFNDNWDWARSAKFSNAAYKKMT